jgi:tRNA/rRNA methyltransferase
MANEQFIFILVEPAVAENVGACARALKTMGFGRLAIVNSVVHRKPEAMWLAHGSADVMDGIEEFESLAEAVKESDLVIGTTAKKRRVHADYIPCYEIPALIDGKGPLIERVALVFGREESGLTNEELGLCNVFTGIPMQEDYPSLNLSQAVMIYAWEISRYFSTPALPVTPGLSRKPDLPTNAPSVYKLRHLRRMVKSLLGNIGFDDQDPLYNRIAERFEALNDKDAGLLLSVCSKIQEALENCRDLPADNSI